MSRQTELAQIHIAKKALGMDDDTYRNMLQSTVGCTSSASLDVSQRHAVLQRFKELGWKNTRKPNPKKGVKSRKPSKDGTPRKSQGDKIRALWITMAQQGIIRSESEASLRHYVQRMSNNQYAAPQFCDTATAARIIESLKKWQARELKKQAKGNH